MTSLATVKLFEAEHYIEDALGRMEREGPYSATVAVCHATDAIILSVDALCHSRGVGPPKRHDQGIGLFADLIRQEKIPATAAHWRDFLATSNRQRTVFQYDGELASQSEARRFVRKAADFVAFVRTQIV